MGFFGDLWDGIVDVGSSAVDFVVDSIEDVELFLDDISDDLGADIDAYGSTDYSFGGGGDAAEWRN